VKIIRTKRRKHHMKRFKTKKAGVAILLALGMLLSACGGNGIEGNDASNASSEQGTEGNTTDGAVSATGPVGRYVEQAITLPSLQNPQFFSVTQDDNSILICGRYGQDLLSKDGGLTYTIAGNVPASFQKKVAGYAFITASAASPSGHRLCVLYESGGETGEGISELTLYLPEGEPIQLRDVPVDLFVEVIYAPDGYFYVADGVIDSNRIYRIDPTTGESEVLFQLEDTAQEICVDGKRLYAIVNQKVVVYDLETKSLEESDPLLSNSLAAGYEDDEVTDGSASALMMPDPKQEGIYFVNKSGLYYHVLHGSVVEQLIDGTLCSIGDTATDKKSFIAMAGFWNDDLPVFSIVYSDGTVMRYTYSDDAQSVPSSVLRIYSLYEDENINLAVSAFRAIHPEIQILYEIGIEEDSGVTPEDARSLLTMELAAGEGPGVIVMDNMPFAPYAEKGVFADLSQIRSNLADEEFFEAAAEVYREDEFLSAIPAAFSIPLLTAKGDVPSNMTTLASLADVTEAFRAKSPKDSVCNIYTASLALGMLASASGGAWMPDDTQVDMDAIREFLTQAKRIYNAQMVGETAKREEEGLHYNGITGRDADLFAQQINYFHIMLELRNSNAWVAGSYVSDTLEQYVFQSSLNHRGTSYVLMPGQNYGAGNVQTLLTVNQSSPDKESAMEFVEYMLSTEFQSESRMVGIGINKDAFHQKQEAPTDLEYSSIGMGATSDSGEIWSETLRLKWPSETDFQKLEDTIMKLIFDQNCDPRVYDKVIEVGSKVLLGEISIDDGVTEIENSMSLLLSE
jgi:ABC-type glycerol-3-phosphate transport system substrate-binding protein